MNDENNKSKQKVISKKWLYGSLAIIALVLGIILNSDALADAYNPVFNLTATATATEQVKVDNENDNDADDFIEDDSED